MPEEQQQSKGQSFLTQSFLKNQSVANKGSDIGALNRTMGTFTTKNIKALDSLTKQMQRLSDNLVKMVRPSAQKKDFVRREDPTLRLLKEVDDLEELMKENNKYQKERQKKGGKGLLSLLGLFGAGLGLTGLIGYFLTGKKEMLFSTVKGLMKYSPLKILTKGLDFALKKAFGFVAKGVSKIPGLKKLGANVGEFVVKNIDSFMKPLYGMFKGVGKVFGPIGKIFGKGLGKAAGKAAGKGVGKAFLKKVPIVGSLLGLFFGIQRFKQGDIAGGLLEVASGISSIIPGVGTALGVAIDSFLIFRDIKGTDVVDGTIASAGKKALSKIGEFATWENLKHVPGIAPIAGFMSAKEKWKTDKIGAIKEFIIGAANVIPGLGTIAAPFLGFVEKFIKDKGGVKEAGAEMVDMATKAITDPVGTGKELISKGISGTKKAVKDKVGGVVSGVKDWFGGIGDKLESGSASLYAKSEDFLYEQPQKDHPQRDLGKISGERGNGWYTYKKWKPNIKGLNPKVWNNFQAMASEYYNKTGDMIQINSAYRNQKNSLHGVGYAIDINSKDANNLEKQGLMKKYGFHRPLLGWKKKETWHIEPYPGEDYGPRNTNNYAVRKAISSGKVEIGGGGLNLPQTAIQAKAQRKERQGLDLSERTIEMLAKAMGASFKGAMPRPVAGNVSIDASVRG